MNREPILNRYTYPKLKQHVQNNFPGHNVDDILIKKVDPFGRMRFLLIYLRHI